MYYDIDTFLFYCAFCVRLFRFRVANRTRGSRAPCRTSVVEERTEREDRTEGETRRHVILIMLYENIYMIDLKSFAIEDSIKKITIFYL